GAAIVFTGTPMGCDPALLLEPVQRGIERPIADLQNVARHLLQALANRPTMQRLERENLQNQEIQCSLNRIRPLTHPFTSVTETNTIAPLVEQGEKNGDRLRNPHFLAKEDQTVPTLIEDSGEIGNCVACPHFPKGVPGGLQGYKTWSRTACLVSGW